MRRDRDFIERIYKEHLNGKTLKDLDREYKTDSYYLFKKYNLKTINYKISKRLYGFELNWCFDEINNEYESYILGLLYADGYISNNQIGLRLNKKDKILLQTIKNYFSEDIKLQEDVNSCSFVISSKNCCNNITELGFKKYRKNESFCFPNKLNNNLIKHFIRGYFDGDGTIFPCKVKGVLKYFKGNICCTSYNFLNLIREELLKNDIYTTVNIEKRVEKTLVIPTGLTIGKKDMYRLFFRRKGDIYKLYKYFYEDSNIFLQRKKDIFDEFCKFNNMPTLS